MSKNYIENLIYNKLNDFNGNSDSKYRGKILDESSIENNFDIYFQEISDYISIMERNKCNYAYRPINQQNGLLNSVKVFVKKVQRKLIKWYIEPICYQQTDFNNAVVSSFGRILENMNFLKKHMEENNNQLRNYENIIYDMKIENENKSKSLEEKVSELENKIRAELNDFYKNLENKDNINIKQIKMVKEEVDSGNGKINSIEEMDVKIKIEENFWIKQTYSQSGEDSIIAYILMVLGKDISKCTYLDLGANHAKDLSNTYYMYTKGARGVLVEPNKDLIPELRLYRSEDIIINKCISGNDNEFVEFFVLNGDGLSSSDKSSVEQFISINSDLDIVDTYKVQTITVNKILDFYFRQSPTLLNIDIEGMEMEVLNNLDFDKYRPLIIIVEMIDYDIKLTVGEKNSEIKRFLEDKNYLEYAFTGINSIFLDKSQI